ncbi:MAG: Crp/Fnr family transcriptional regulator [Gammaproteobacteria bacterium]|nr:Crp/Fnr family transcriptional regulator [Gammaproteobacteria bacterium]
MITQPVMGGAQGSTPFPDLLTLDDPIWHSILDTATELKSEAGTVLLESGERVNNFMFLKDGAVRVYEAADDGRELFLYKVTPGDVCMLNLMAMLEQPPCHFKAIAETDITALSINANMFQNAIDNSAPFRNRVFSALAQRMYGLMNLIDNLAFQSLGDRLMKRLYEKLQEQNSNTIQTTHQELASELGTSREVVSRLLKNFESRVGAIRLRRGAIEVLDNQCLRQYADKGIQANQIM